MKGETKMIGLRVEPAGIEALKRLAGEWGVSQGRVVSMLALGERSVGRACVGVALESKPVMKGGFIAPRGSFSKEELRALIAGDRPTLEARMREEAVSDFQDMPHAPFDFNDDEGNLHRVRAYGNTLKVCFMRDGVEEPVRNLGAGELEILWEKRING